VERSWGEEGHAAPVAEPSLDHFARRNQYVTPDYLNTDIPFDSRARDLVSRMTLEEKVSQMLNDSPAIERLGVPAYNWWNECLHGVARAGTATVFPQAIGLAATWNTDLIHAVATAISDEARAKHHEALRHDDHSIYRGLTFWTPNINIFRDPRWGRGHETYGEDPYLTGRIGVAFVRGLQGDDPKYLKLVATPKHYAVHSGPEKDRHHFDAQVSMKDLYETYLPAFKTCVQEGGAVSVMGAYNRTLGEPCCASRLLLQQILRDEWGFDGYVVSDCGAITDIHANHKVAACSAESAAMSVKAGCDLECGCSYASLLTAVERGLITEDEIDVALTRLFTARMRLGMFDPPEMVPYAQIPYEVNDCEEHRELALQAARESIVLLKNQPWNGEALEWEGEAPAEPDSAGSPPPNSLLPLPKTLRSIAVIGPNADSLDVLLGNYNGTPSKWVTPLAGIRAKAEKLGIRVFYAQGCDLIGDSRFHFSEAISAAEAADVSIVCLGLSPRVEGEEGDAAFSEAGGDRKHIDLPGVQEELLTAVYAVGKPVVLVLTNGSAVAINWASENVPAIIEAWYPGEEGGTAIADVLFGDYNPAGRLPVTFYKSLDDVPPFEDYNMTGRTYRYFSGEPLYPFGFGLSYTLFEYGGLTLSSDRLAPGEDLELSVEVANAGDRAGDEVAQVYLTDLDASVTIPIRKLVGFQRVHLEPGESRRLTFLVGSEQLSVVDQSGRAVLEPGEFEVAVGGSQGDERSLALGASRVVRARFEIVG
jgi:beta-glucosidase